MLADPATIDEVQAVARAEDAFGDVRIMNRLFVNVAVRLDFVLTAVVVPARDLTAKTFLVGIGENLSALVFFERGEGGQAIEIALLD